MNQIEDMQTFVRIVEAGSITRAAEQLNTVKSAVSRRLSQLEKRLGVSLLTRTTRHHTLTEHGQSYYQQSLRIIEEVAVIEASLLQENCALSGRIRISAPLVFGIEHLSQAFLAFNELHPDIIFDVDFDDKKIDLVEGGYDLAIRIAKLEDSNLIARKITSTRMVLCASQKYLKEYGTPVVPQDLTTKHKKLLYNKAHETWHFIDDKAKSVSIKLPTALTSNNGNFLLESAIKGGGLLNVPDFICYKAIKQGKLQLVLNNYLVHTTIPIYALYPQNRHLSHRIRRLVDFLVEYYGDKPYWLI
ncbi:MAG: LysR family transcriptional regulator [Oceanospirillaceae bacterium]|nr:LysR family transcriptional regulator [Oceanospirillaceae bacterium]